MKYNIEVYSTKDGAWALFNTKGTLEEARKVASNVFLLTEYDGVRIMAKEGDY